MLLDVTSVDTFEEKPWCEDGIKLFRAIKDATRYINEPEVLGRITYSMVK
jgi:hypothetical protein